VDYSCEMEFVEFAIASDLSLKRPIRTIIKGKLQYLKITKEEEDALVLTPHQDMSLNTVIYPITTDYLKVWTSLEETYLSTILKYCTQDFAQKNNISITKNTEKLIRKQDIRLHELNKKLQFIFVPFYECEYEFKNQKYYVIINAVTGKIDGERPDRPVQTFGVMILFLLFILMIKV